MKVSIIIPAFNEEESIAKLYERLSMVLGRDGIINGYDYELIFIDDGSKDKTINEIKKASDMDDKVKYISFSRNFGKEAAMLAGLSYSTGDYSLIMDSDLQHPPELIPQMIEKSREGYDQVIAKRNRTGDDKSRTVMTHLYYKLINRLIDVKLEDGVGDFRLLSRKAVDALVSMNEYTRFSKGMFSWIGFKSATIEYENVAREAGETKWSFSSLFRYAIDGIMSFNDRPLRISIYVGFWTMLVGLIYVIYSLIRVMVVGIETPGYFTIIFAILFMGGVTLISVGILGEYLGKIYYEVKKRPHFLIQETNLEKRSSKDDKQNYTEI